MSHSPRTFLLTLGLVGASGITACGSSRVQVVTTVYEPARTESAPATELSLPPEPAVYAADGIVSLEQGSAVTWLRMQSGIGRRDHLVFATDDSRLVLVIDTFRSS